MNQYEKEHLEMIRSGLPECAVLLKSNGDFPLDHAGKIAAYGSGIRHTVKGGTGSGEVNSRYFVTVEEGLEEEGFTVTSKEWIAEHTKIRAAAKEKFLQDIRKSARKHRTLPILEGMGKVMPEPEYDLPLDAEGDCAVYVVSRICGEGNDREAKPGDFELTATEIREILECNRKYPKFMLVINTGGPVDLSPVTEAENILVLSQLGVETGHVLARLLTGKYYPSGKLASTWAKYEDYCDIGTFGEEEDTRYKEGIYVGYRYFDTVNKEPLFPFGFGLGYTTFRIEHVSTEISGQTVTVTADVTNTGNYAGKEVLQVYASCPYVDLDKPYQELCAFGKTGELKPGETERMNLEFRFSSLASYDEKKEAYVLEKGDYILRLGNSSRCTEKTDVLRLEETLCVRKVHNCLGNPDFKDWKPAFEGEEDTEGLPVHVIDKSLIPHETVSYEKQIQVSPEVFSWSEDELIRCNIGSYSESGGIANVIGSSGKSVAGAAGETTSALLHRHVPVLVMADGPAGLRLSRQYYIDKKGIHSLGQGLPDTMADLLPSFIRRRSSRPAKLPKGVTVREQNTTAIPIGTAIAQTWNVEYARKCGDAVGEEMERFGVHLWLAPALNIHRNPLCGRNFEYYSEDPLISGKMAAAITEGVQSHKGCGVTVKHFAFNNQEKNRYNNNSILSERAAREIYLKGFEICIREAKPLALMTSYNLVNGTHTSEQRGLCTDILRREFGFEGIVMTDWVVSAVNLGKKTKYPSPDAAKVAEAGGNLFMPGSRKEYRQLVRGLKNGTVSKLRLMESADYVRKVTQKLK